MKKVATKPHEKGHKQFFYPFFSPELDWKSGLALGG